MDYVDRIKAGLRAKGKRPTDLARALDVSHQSIYGLLGREWPGTTRLPEIAEFLGTTVEFLTSGAAPAPSWDPAILPSTEVATAASATADSIRSVVREDGIPYQAAPHDDSHRRPFTGKRHQMPLVGTVGAGPGVVTTFSPARAFTMRKSWALMRIAGNSAYPVAFDGQYVVVDTDRPLRHNNLVIVQTQDGKSYLKRYCQAPNAPDGFVLASINAGVDTPYIPQTEILAMLPVVGILFEEEPSPTKEAGP